MNKLFCFGVGFTGLQTCEYFNDQKWITSGTTRDRNKKVNPNIELIEYNPNKGKVYLSESLASSKILLISIAPDKNGDVVLKSNYEDIANALKTSVKRVIYLSTTAVYGDANGSTVDEKYKINPQSDRAKSRILAEGQWTDLCDKFGVTLNILRLSGIYGTGRNQIRNLNKKIGQNKFYKQLLKLDPLSKNKINPTDTQRSIRAFEVKKFTKKSLHDWFKNTKSNYIEEDFFKVYIDYPRDELIERIHQRTGKMIKMGAVNEVKRFLKLKIKKQMTAFKAIGVNEIQEYLSKEKKIDEIKEKISIKTRQYAKRQSTWARGHMSDWVKLKPSEINKFLKKI